MPDDFGRILRDGAARAGAELDVADALLVRARGDQRRKRQAVGSIAFALAIVMGGGAAYAIGEPGQSVPPVGPGAPTATATPGSAMTPTRPASTRNSPTGTSTATPGAAGTRTLRLGHLVLRVPEAWRVTYSDAQGDYTVSTGACASHDLLGGEGGSSGCAAFNLIVGAGAQRGGMPPYLPRRLPYTDSTGVTGCPTTSATPRASPMLRSTPVKPYHFGSAPVTSTRTADYTVWRFACDGPTSGPIFYFEQRDWYLPVQDILIVDEYETPGLAQILTAATWQ
jgi:hypothetical protein